MKKPKGLDSGEVLRCKRKKKTLSPGDKLEIIMNMVERVEKCPTCGHEKEVGFIDAKQAKKLLGY